MKRVVISLGGSVIIPDEVNYKFLKKLRNILRKNYHNHKFIIVCGGGSIARKYIAALKDLHRNKKQLAISGIRATRMNALFLMQFFGKEANDFLPLDMKSVRDKLHKNNVVICGALRFTSDSTSDGTAARIASLLKCEFINITDVDGLYTDDPHTNKHAKLVENITWKDFSKKLNAVKFEAGQHFVLDQQASKIILEKKITTYIVGPHTRNLNKLIRGKKFIGTTIAK